MRYKRSLLLSLTGILLDVAAAQVTPIPIPFTGGCETIARLQMEARTKKNEPVAGLAREQVDLRTGHEALEVESIRDFVVSSQENATTSLLVVVWPQAQLDAHVTEDLLRALRAEETTNWRVGLISPSIQPLIWRSLDDLAAPLYEAAEAAAKVQWVAPNVRPVPAGRINVSTWNMVVRATAEALISQPGRHVILEIPPRPLDPPGEHQLLASASFGSSPVYRLTRTGGLDASLSIPFGDASTGPTFGPSGNVSSNEQQDAQLAAVRSASFLDAIRRKLPQPALLFGGTNLSSPKEIVHRIVTDAAGSYEVTARKPKNCNPGAIYGLTFHLIGDPRKVLLYGPRFFYDPISSTHP